MVQQLFLAGPLANIGKNIFQAGGFRSGAGVAGQKTIGTIFKNFFAGGGKAITRPVFPKSGLRLPKPSGGTKLLLGTGLVTTGLVSTQLFLTTDEGQRTLDSFDSSIDKLTVIGEGVGDTFEGFTNFFSDNPILLPLLLGLGLVLAVKS